MSKPRGLRRGAGYGACADDAGFGEAPQQAFLRLPRAAKMASVSTLALLAVSASPNFTWVHVRFAFQGHFRYNRFNGR